MSVLAAQNLPGASRDDWRTPPEVLERVRRVAPIGLDPCTAIGNPTGASIFAVAPGAWPAGEPLPWSARIDGLSFPWAMHCPEGELVFVNPPYSRGNLGVWTKRCAFEACFERDIIALVPADTSTDWWHESCRPATKREWGPPCCAHHASSTAHDPETGRCLSDGCRCPGRAVLGASGGADAVCFWRGRLSFVGSPGPAPFASALVYWGENPHRFIDAFHGAGAIWI